MTSCFNSHFSCTPNRSKLFETNSAGKQNFFEKLFFKAVFTNGTNSLAGKGLMVASFLVLMIDPCLKKQQQQQQTLQGLKANMNEVCS